MRNQLDTTAGNMGMLDLAEIVLQRGDTIMWCCKQHAHASAAGDNCEAPGVSTLVHLNGSGLPP